MSAVCAAAPPAPPARHRARASRATRAAAPPAPARRRRRHREWTTTSSTSSSASSDPRSLVVARAEFAQIDAESEDAPGGVAEGRFGPDAILMVGFTAEETTRWRAELDDIEAEFVKLVTCTTAMASGALGAALEATQDDPAAVAASSEAYDENGRVMIFSGMIGGEVVALVDLWRTTGMDDTLFACLVPNNENSDVAGLVSEIADDHREMLAKVAAEREGK